MSSPISFFIVICAAFAINFVPNTAVAQDQGNIWDSDIWHEVKLYCDTDAMEAIITIRGTSFRGLHETPASITKLISKMRLEPEGACRWSNGQLLRIETLTPPYEAEGRCGSEPPAAINLTLADQIILRSWQYFDCHEGYAASAIILHEDDLKFCASESECAEAGKRLIHAN